MKLFLFVVLLLITFFPVMAEDVLPVALTYSGSGTYYLVERSDISRYDNGKYSGLTRREVRSCIVPSSTVPAEYVPQYRAVSSRSAGGTLFSGSFFVLEETVKNNTATVKGISGDVPSSFYISKDGVCTMLQDEGFPSYRSFPAYPAQTVQPGSVWQAEAERVVDPLNSGAYTRLKIYVQYTFKGEETYKGQAVYRIAAKWATRYGMSYRDRSGDPSLKSATGTHDADILVLKSTGAAMLVRDRMDETFTYDSGATVRFKGVTLLFTEFPPSLEKSDVITILRGTASSGDRPQDVATLAPSGGNNVALGDPVSPSDETKTPTPKDITKSPVPETGDTNSKISGTKATQTVTPPVTQPAKKVSTTPPVVIEETDKGVRISIRNLQFKPDSAELLASERGRIAEIAEKLKNVPTAMFLVEGHSAPTGRPEGEQRLSEERAKYIANELARYGIQSDRFICAGRGSTRPLTKDSAELSQNRRVEITILM